MPASVVHAGETPSKGGHRGKRPRSPTKQASPRAPPPKKQRHARTSPQQYKSAAASNLHNSSAPPTKHGSYRHYYKRRLQGNDPSTDDRLPLIRQLCAAYKPFTMLDVGCNDGQILMQLARHPDCANAVGVDIDTKLIRRARGALRMRIHNGEKAEAKQSPRTPSHAISFPFNTSFRVEDMSAEQASQPQSAQYQYHLVLCLSVTKWVHLDGGDAAIQRLFHTMYECLKPGGVLVLEPQPPKSYKLARQKGLAPKSRSFDHLKLKPSMFPDYLLKQCGFSAMRVLRDKSPAGKAFNRPIFAFFKGEHAPSLRLFDEAHPEQSHNAPETNTPTTANHNSNSNHPTPSPSHENKQSTPPKSQQHRTNAGKRDKNAKKRDKS
ncbi:putative RNA methyltransferase [Gracilariopsis chorda]|uniref:RNA methyltransferase n=1 Tax=Gracilariopsis chorda TaxID=448386 RepID=A0A2V3IV73_9FLOR|nr:putative RNA methyltransferase [Gracilariopsis chorda]|eukprot:PXF45040.1 putative RNA methyltransferase [Gracilariopsis chorda]